MNSVTSFLFYANNRVRDKWPRRCAQPLLDLAYSLN